MGEINWNKEISKRSEIAREKNRDTREFISSQIDVIGAEDIIKSVKERVLGTESSFIIARVRNARFYSGYYHDIPIGDNESVALIRTDKPQSTFDKVFSNESELASALGINSFNSISHKAALSVIEPSEVFENERFKLKDYFSVIISAYYQLVERPKIGGSDKDRVSTYVYKSGRKLYDYPHSLRNDQRRVLSLSEAKEEVISFFIRMTSEDLDIIEHGGFSS